MSDTMTEFKEVIGDLPFSIVDLSEDGTEAYGLVYHEDDETETKIGFMVNDGATWTAGNLTTLGLRTGLPSAVAALNYIMEEEVMSFMGSFLNLLVG
jgi:hypothetical protein